VSNEGYDVYSLRITAFLLILISIVFHVNIHVVMAADVGGAALSQVEGAEEAVSEAYLAVLEAGREGADVSGLLEQLNLSGEYLAAARMCLRKGDLEGAVGNASLCVQSLDGLVGDAGALKDTAIKEAGERFFMAIGGSATGIGVVVGGCWLGGRWFKKRYKRMRQTEAGVV
jgi:hypothetical protein